VSAQTAGPRPNLFIIGAPKCGTTSLYEYLKGHPQVYMSAAKEPGYFAPDNLARGSHNLRYGTDEERYLALFDQAGQAKHVGEASVGYIYSAQAPQLIHEWDPGARIIVMFRDPLKMIPSLHNQRLAEGREHQDSFRAAIEREIARHGRTPPRDDEPPAPGSYRDRALFSRYLPSWLDKFGREQVLVILLEDLEREPAAVFRRVLEFLNVDPDWQPEAFRVHNVRHQPRSRVVAGLLKAGPPQWFVWTLLPRIVGDANTRRLVRAFRHSPLNRKQAPRNEIDPELRRQLEEYFEADVARLSDILGRDLGSLWWGRPAQRAHQGPAAGSLTSVSTP